MCLIKNKRLTKTYFISALLLTSGLVASNSYAEEIEGDAAKGLEIAIEADKRSNGFVDSASKMQMILKNRHGETSTRQVRVRSMEIEGDGDKSMTIFDTPTDVKGTALLTFSHKVKNDDQWLYLPALRRAKRMSSSNKSGPFMGSEFAFEDLGSQEVDKYKWSYLKDETLNGVDCFVVQRIPTDKRSGYTKQIMWINKAEYTAIKVDYYDRKKSLLKTLINSDFKLHKEKFWRPHTMDMVNHQTGKSTQLLWAEIKMGNGFKESAFTKKSLARIK